MVSVRFERRRRLAYARRAAAAGRRPAGYTGGMLFDARPAALPVARVRSGSWTGSAAARLRGALEAMAGWVRPRVVPLAVAVASAVALLSAADYLSNLARTPPSTTTHIYVSVQPG